MQLAARDEGGRQLLAGDDDDARAREAGAGDVEVEGDAAGRRVGRERVELERRELGPPSGPWLTGGRVGGVCSSGMAPEKPL
ncbi:hypothetical protein [Nannocystis pusilla]|uniref:hypothetical protein n=1 Tax=Nannocystis pusilla TaxID=889268 RepID=UPI003B7BC29F